MASEFHYRGPIPLPVVRIGLVTSFVFEYMYLVCLGVVWNLVKLWLMDHCSVLLSVASRLPEHSYCLMTLLN